MGTILVIDPDTYFSTDISMFFGSIGHSIFQVSDMRSAVLRLGEHDFDAVISCVPVPGGDIADLVKEVRKRSKQTAVIAYTDAQSIEEGLRSVKEGAFSFLQKPFSIPELNFQVRRALQGRQDQKSSAPGEEDVYRPYNFIGESPTIKSVFKMVNRVAKADVSVIILGETGTGKELVAGAIHYNSLRADGPFVRVNCAALPEQLLESELFGYEKGAFTGADRTRVGRFEHADGGTIFLDEIGDMPLALQAKLLRVLETGTARPVGSDTDRRVDVRFLAATHRDIAQRARAGEFREDLFFRLKVLSIKIPPLRDRKDDIPLLVKHFLDLSRKRNPTSPVEALSAAALRELLAHSWPGNVRELEHTIERLVVAGTEKEVSAETVRADIEPWEVQGKGHPLDRARSQLLPLREATQLYIDWVVTRVGGSRTRAAEVLGVHPSTLYRRDQNKEEP